MVTHQVSVKDESIPNDALVRCGLPGGIFSDSFRGMGYGLIWASSDERYELGKGIGLG